MAPFKTKDLWFSALWEHFFKFHKLPEFKKPFSVAEWRDYFNQLGKKYVLENLYCVNWLESESFKVFANTEQIKFLEGIVEGFDIVNRQLGLNFQLRNLRSPTLVQRADVEKFVKLRRRRERNYGLLFVFDSLPPDTQYSPQVFSDGSAFPIEGIATIGHKEKIKPQEKSELARQLKITVAHELFESLTPEHVPHCNHMAFVGEYMIAGKDAKKYHTKRCLHSYNSIYSELCPLCKDMAVYFLKGVKETKKK